MQCDYMFKYQCQKISYPTNRPAQITITNDGLSDVLLYTIYIYCIFNLITNSSGCTIIATIAT
jgi:hypothetical protein